MNINEMAVGLKDDIGPCGDWCIREIPRQMVIGNLEFELYFEMFDSG